MAKITVFPPTTGIANNVEIDLSKIQAETITILADTLAGVEEVTFSIYTGNDTFKTWISNSAGAYKLTATQYMLTLPNPGVVLRVSKTATVGSCGVIISWPESTKRGY